MIRRPNARTRKEIADHLRMAAMERDIRDMDEAVIGLLDYVIEPMQERLERTEARLAMLEFVGGAQTNALDGVQVQRDLGLPRVASEGL